jgi:midasin
MDSASAKNEEQEHSQAREDEDQVDSQHSDAQEDQDLQSEGSGENDEYKRDVDQGVVDMEDQ